MRQRSKLKREWNKMGKVVKSRKVKRTKKADYKIAVLDFETDSFKHGRIPEPFAADFYDGETHHVFWGRDCVEQLSEFLYHAETK